jgi:hypothetical protein
MARHNRFCENRLWEEGDCGKNQADCNPAGWSWRKDAPTFGISNTEQILKAFCTVSLEFILQLIVVIDDVIFVLVIIIRSMITKILCELSNTFKLPLDLFNMTDVWLEKIQISK